MFIDDLHFQVDQGILVQVYPDIQKKGFVVNGLAKHKAGNLPFSPESVILSYNDVGVKSPRL